MTVRDLRAILLALPPAMDACRVNLRQGSGGEMLSDVSIIPPDAECESGAILLWPRNDTLSWVLYHQRVDVADTSALDPCPVCPACGGLGDVETIDKHGKPYPETCSRCHGSGTILPVATGPDTLPDVEGETP